MEELKAVGAVCVERAYNDPKLEWQEISTEELIRRVEWSGYFKKGTAVLAMADMYPNSIRAPWAFFRIRKKSDEIGRAHV